ncbi:jg25518 [Pararge aegeria aegeria]|uniref:Jg25518 protein n=1 Tax=Pararge aegeria aegeria TaxID=348720 RepID=A0A8S4RWX0_9NEOP|nr:jg25518 [Pararge aegeria aegeria]
MTSETTARALIKFLNKKGSSIGQNGTQDVKGRDFQTFKNVLTGNTRLPGLLQKDLRGLQHEKEDPPSDY